MFVDHDRVFRFGKRNLLIVDFVRVLTWVLDGDRSSTASTRLPQAERRKIGAKVEIFPKLVNRRVLKVVGGDEPAV